MEVVPLSNLATILAAVMGPMLVFAVAIMRYQHVDSTKTRDLIEKSHAELSSRLSEVRERLAHIEGFLRIWRPPPPDDDGEAIAA